MTLRQQSTMTATSADVLAMPAHMQARAHQIAAARASRMEELRVAAEERHEQRCAEDRTRLMDGGCALASYRASIAESAAQRDADVADAPPPVDLGMMSARVEARVLDAVAGWWSDDLDRSAQAQREWTPAHNDGDDAGDDADVETGEQEGGDGE